MSNLIKVHSSAGCSAVCPLQWKHGGSLQRDDVKDKQTAGFMQTKPNSDDGKAIVRTDECRNLRYTPLYDHRSYITPSEHITKQYTKYCENIDSNIPLLVVQNIPGMCPSIPINTHLSCTQALEHFYFKYLAL